jgi:hypothetical protein
MTPVPAHRRFAQIRFLDVFGGKPGDVLCGAIWFFNPNGIEALSPGVARNELPWVKIGRNDNPARVEFVS